MQLEWPGTFEAAFESAVTLNNYGIALLERHCYQQAMPTLRDSLQIMQSLIFVAQQGFTSQHCPTFKLEIDRYLQDCYFRLANPIISKPTNICIQSLSNTNRRLMTRSGESPECVYIIRVDHFQHDERTPVEVLEGCVAIAMHNLAMAYFCAAKNTTHDPSPYISKALSLSEMSASILESLEVECEDEHQFRSIACIDVTVINGALQIMKHSSSQQPEYEQSLQLGHANVMFPFKQARYTDRLTHLEATVNEIDEEFFYLVLTPTTATAA